MIARDDQIVTMSYPRRDVVGNGERTEIVTFVGSPTNIATLVARHVQSWLRRGADGPMTLHVTNRFNVIDADARAEELSQ